MKLISKVFFGLFFLTLNFSSVTAHSSTSEGYHPGGTHTSSSEGETVSDFSLGTDSNTETMTVDNSDGSWTDWVDCEDVSGSNSAPRNFIVYSLRDEGNWAKITSSCRQLENWTTRGAYTLRNHFNTADSGTEDNTQIDSDKLPIGMALVGTNSQIMSFYFMGQTPEDILAGETSDVEYSSDAGGVNIAVGMTHLLDFDELRCNAGRIVTGIRLKTDDANWPNNGKLVTGVSLHCTELTE